MRKGLLVADFNADNLAAILSNSDELPKLAVTAAPFGQVSRILIDESASCWSDEPDFAIVWTRPEGIAEAYGAALEFDRVSVEDVWRDVDAFADQITRVSGRMKFVLVSTWLPPRYHRGYGLLDLRSDVGLSALLMRMNLRLIERLDGLENVYLLNAQRWLDAAGNRAYSNRSWYMGKIGYTADVMREAAADVRAAVDAVTGNARKLVVVDLDDTLWGGIVGDDGWESLVLGGHNPAGEALVDFQRALKALTRRGIVLGIVSKNDEAVALHALSSHPEMVLRQDDFAGWRINWNDKAQNLVDLAQELNLGLQSVVFIDDNPVERARVREMLPEVLVPEWPSDKSQYKQALLSLSCFDSPVLSAEDSSRTKMYVTERHRSELKRQVGSVDEWLKGLRIKVDAEVLDQANLARASQLFNKTNQMNLTTRRMTAGELLEWADKENHRMWTFRVQDRFGDAGLTGIASVSIEGETAVLTDFLLSCRVMGRKVEETMVAVAAEHARNAGATELVARYVETAKNRPCREFWARSGFTEAEGGVYCWDLATPYLYPEQVEVRVAAAA